jgi:hypothetical protein
MNGDFIAYCVLAICAVLLIEHARWWRNERRRKR